jgi:hypothetical protein
VLMLAANNDVFDITKLLLDAGAEVNAQDKVLAAHCRFFIESPSQWSYPTQRKHATT